MKVVCANRWEGSSIEHIIQMKFIILSDIVSNEAEIGCLRNIGNPYNYSMASGQLELVATVIA